VNGLQFYDWQYRHETLLPPDGMEPYSDVLGRVQSLAAVKGLIEAAHARNIAAMPYTAIYGASYAFYEQHKDWALFALKDVPYDFAGFLKIMDPAPGSPWATHLLGEFAAVLDKTDFDGIHIDQYGAPMHGRNAEGGFVDLEDAFPAFIDAAAAVVHEKRGEDGVTIFNNVRNWPTATTAPSDQDAVYIEVWEPYRYFMDLARIVSEAQKLGGGKPVIIAAYIPPERIENVRISNALIFASGAYHLELGEPGGMLQHAYFPNYGTMSEAVQDLERRYYDFIVRYENVLAVGTSDATAARADALRIDGVKTDGRGSQDRVAVIVRKGANRETFSLVNLMGIDGGYWDAPVTQGATPLRDLAVRVQVDAPVKAVWLATPDGEPSAQAVDFTSESGAIGFSVPTLDAWTMIVVEYA
jgi:dextranase